MYDNTGAKKRVKKEGNVYMTQKTKKKNKKNDRKNRKKNRITGNRIMRKEGIKNKRKEMRYKINGKKMKKYKKTCYETKGNKVRKHKKTCYESNDNKVRKKKTGMRSKRRKERRVIKNATLKEGNTKKGKEANSTSMYGMYGSYSTQGTRNKSADRPPARRYTKENNKHRPACTQQQYTVQTQLRRNSGVGTSCCSTKTVCETNYVLYVIYRTKGNKDNGIWCKCWNGIPWLSAQNINKTLQVNWPPITESYISKMDNEKGAPTDPDYNLQFPILGQRKGNICINPIMWPNRECSIKWNRRSSRYRE
jgi:hypothetical protein